MITGVDFVSVPCQDLAAAREVYGEVLGLEPAVVSQRGDVPAVGAEFENGPVPLALMDCPALGLEFRPSVGQIAFRVDDVTAARAELEAKGVTFHDTIDSGVCHMAFFSDPDGNALMLHHRYAPREPAPTRC